MCIFLCDCMGKGACIKRMVAVRNSVQILLQWKKNKQRGAAGGG